MKRDEFLNQFTETWLNCHTETTAELAARMAETAGLVWDPEEPELPERVEVRRRPGMPLFLGTENGVDTADSLDAIAKEARRRYHAWGALREWLAVHYRDWTRLDPADILAKLDSLLQEEG